MRKYILILLLGLNLQAYEWSKDYNSIISAEMGSFFNKSEDYWIRFFKALSKLESNFNPNTEYQENFRNSKGEWVISTGLFQISLESSQGYRCGFNDQAGLRDPIKNLGCAIKIIKHWIRRDQTIYGRDDDKWIGGARYWSVLRSNNSRYQLFLEKLGEQKLE